MRSTVTRKPQVWLDLVTQAEYIARQSRARSDRFLDAVEASFRQLAATPEIGFACDFRAPGAAGLRWWRVRRHRHHLIFYRPTATGIEIIRVLHAARDIENLFEQIADE